MELEVSLLRCIDFHSRLHLRFELPRLCRGQRLIVAADVRGSQLTRDTQNQEGCPPNQCFEETCQIHTKEVGVGNARAAADQQEIPAVVPTGAAALRLIWIRSAVYRENGERSSESAG